MVDRDLNIYEILTVRRELYRRVVYMCDIFLVNIIKVAGDHMLL